MEVYSIWAWMPSCPGGGGCPCGPGTHGFGNKKNLSADKPDSVFPIKPGGHHLSCHNITVMILLPTLQRCRGVIRDIERAALRRWYMWHYSTQGLPTNTVTRNNRALLPHVFTLIPIVK